LVRFLHKKGLKTGDISAVTDKDLIVIAKDGDPVALERLFQRHSARIFRLAFQYVCSYEDAEDVVQETFLKVYAGIRSYDVNLSGGFPAWINRICIRSAIDFLRVRNRHVRRMTSLEALPQDPPSPCPTPEQIAVDRGLLRQVEKAAVGLPARQRSLFFLRYQEQMKIRQIAGRLECNESNIRAQLFRTRTRLRHMFAGMA